MNSFKEEDLQKIEKIIGYSFQDKELLKLCFTHSSCEGKENNERLEFLGDSVIQMAISEKLYLEFPKKAESFLTNARQGIVNGDNLGNIVKKLKLYEFFLYEGDLEKNIGKKAYGSLLESITAGVYLDGGWEKAKDFVFKIIPYSVDNINNEVETASSKNELQEWLAKRGLPLAKYDLLEKIGEDNAPLFKVKVSADGKESIGTGESIKQAHKDGAKKLLFLLKQEK